MILLNWLFQDDVLFQAISRNLSKIISRNEDKFLALGWCLLVRALVESVDNGDQSFWNGQHYTHPCYYVDKLFNIGYRAWKKRTDFLHPQLP